MGEWRAALCATLIASGFAAHADDAADRAFHVEVGQRRSDETNLYRLPPGIDPASFFGEGMQRDDTLATSSAALAGQWDRGSQSIVLDTSVASHRFSRNDDLDHTSGRGLLEWRGQIAKWSTEIGGHRERSLASFANTVSRRKDLLDVTARHGELRFAATPRWSATFGAREAATEHSDVLRSRDNVTTRTASFGVLHQTPRSDTLGIELRRARGEHAREVLDALPSLSDYDERRATVTARYLLASKLQLDGSGGRVERSYPYGVRGDFAGDVWSAALRWAFSAKTGITLERWQDLKAHLDAESEHFVATGSGLTAGWSPMRPVRITVQASREEQRYIGLIGDPLGDAARRDSVHMRTLSFIYAPRERFSLETSYRHEERNSNRQLFDYSAESVAVTWNLEF